MRLIDAEALKEYCMRASKSDDDFRRVSLATLASVIDAQPTAYDVDKVVEELKKAGFSDESAPNRVVEIVKAGGIDGD